MDEIEEILVEAENDAHAKGITGRELTPFLLSYLSDATKGRTLQANLALLRNNARVAAALAQAMSGQE